ncbi:hypothetical protein A5634_10715 [Mycobacterium asiaticum]|uniref:DUF4189 domain-containing protein n=1 Tax=Mycobacterium asiaticum TaxID=1790 RepID=A0A1A3NIM3_MYCAS|nr:hypothetical protein A5634_10715 [Mycobacterium asiaticum]
MTSLRFPRRAALAVMNVAAATVTLVALPPVAHADNQFGAIAYSPSGRLFGRTKDAPSSAAAQSAALGACGNSDCKVLVVFRECGAIAENKAGDHAGGYGSTLLAAEQDAMKRLGTAGWIGTWLCN